MVKFISFTKKEMRAKADVKVSNDLLLDFPKFDLGKKKVDPIINFPKFDFERYKNSEMKPKKVSYKIAFD